MSPDPSGLYYADPANPQSLNLYSYVLNNPLKLVDPSGLGWCYYGNTDPGAGPSDDPSDYDMDSPDASDCKGGQSHDVSTTVTVNGNDGSSTIDTVDTGSAPAGATAYESLHTTHTYMPGSFSACVKEFDPDAYSLQSGLQAISGGHLGNSWLSGAFLGNSVSSAITLGQYGAARFSQNAGAPTGGQTANSTTAVSVGVGTGPVLEAAASRAPSVAVTVAATVQVGNVSATAGVSASAVPLGAMANLGAKALSAFRALKLPVRSFSCWFCRHSFAVLLPSLTVRGGRLCSNSFSRTLLLLEVVRRHCGSSRGLSAASMN